MYDFSYEAQKTVAMQWKNAAPLLRAQRHRDIRKQNNEQAINSLNSAFRWALKMKRPSKTSGFVEMYRVLQRQAND